MSAFHMAADKESTHFENKVHVLPVLPVEIKLWQRNILILNS